MNDASRLDDAECYALHLIGQQRPIRIDRVTYMHVQEIINTPGGSVAVRVDEAATIQIPLHAISYVRRDGPSRSLATVAVEEGRDVARRSRGGGRTG